MPEKLHRCVNDVQSQGKSEDSAWAICNSSLNEAATMNPMSYPDTHMYNSNTIPQQPVTYPTEQNPSYTQGIHENGAPCALCGLEQMMHMGSDHPYVSGAPMPQMEHHIPNNGMGLSTGQEGGYGSGRPQDHAGAGQAGPVVPSPQSAPSMPPMQFTEQKVLKELMDTKLNCKCHKNRK